MRAVGASATVACLLALAPTALADGVDVSSQLDQDVASTDQAITLTVSVTIHGSGDIDRMQFPRSSHFQELGRTQSTQQSFSLGPSGMDVSRSTVFRISLQPKDPGDYDLPPAVAVVGGRSYRSGSVHVKVVPAGQAPPPRPQRSQNPFGQNPFSAFGFPSPFPDDGQDPFQDLFGGGRPPNGQDVFLAAGVDRHNVYLGQQTTYSVRLYTRVDVSEFDGLKLPGFDGFWGEDLETPTHPVPTLQNVGGASYQVFLLKKKALFPSRAGDLTVGPAEVDIGAGGLFFRGHKVHRSSGSIAVHVLPLPAGSPPGFSTSNVGEWNLSASLRPATVPVGEPATLTLIAQGSGNLHALELPRLPAIPGLRAYDPTSSDRSAPNGDRFGGTRKVEIVLIGQRTGDFEIPPLAFSWFDPAARSYQTQSTPPLHLLVSAGAGTPGGTGGAQNVLEASFRPLRTAPALAVHRLPALEGRPLSVVLAAPPLIFALLFAGEELRRRRREAAPELRMRQAYRVARRRLKAAKGLLGSSSPERALAELTGALHGYLEDRAGEKVSGLSHAELTERLRALGAGAEAAGAAVSALEACEAQRYAPGAGGAAGGQDLLSRVEFALEALERSGWKPSRRAA
ncbi:MAG: BatD family protein [Myxococcales bacterium]